MTQSDSEALAGCPFCGGQAVRIGPYGGEGLFGVQCLQCNAGVRGFDQCEQDAVDAWNKRHEEDMSDNQACENTEREIWRGPDEGGGDFYADSLHITKDGALGINCGGSVYVKPIREWHRLAGGPIKMPLALSSDSEALAEKIARIIDPAAMRGEPGFEWANRKVFAVKKAREILALGAGTAGMREARATALARRLCQLFESGGESQRSVRARHASAIFQLLSGGSTNSHEWQRCDADPVRYLEDCERAALAIPQEGK